MAYTLHRCVKVMKYGYGLVYWVTQYRKFRFDIFCCYISLNIFTHLLTEMDIVFARKYAILAVNKRTADIRVYMRSIL